MRVEGANAYIANAHPVCLHDCIFLVCGTCGEATHIDDDTLSETVRTIARNNGFIPERPVMEVLGRCAKCACDRPSLLPVRHWSPKSLHDREECPKCQRSSQIGRASCRERVCQYV